jgi:hypothetical protein
LEQINLVEVAVVGAAERPVLPCGQRRGARARDSSARLLVLERAATAIPDAAVNEVAAAMLAL